MQEIFDNVWNSPSRYVFIIIVAIFVIYIPIFCVYMSRKKKKARTFSAENPNAPKMYLKPGDGQMFIFEINGTTPNSTMDRMTKQGFFLKIGENEVKVQYSWTRPGLMSRTITTTVGPLVIKVRAEAERVYYIKYDKKQETFEFEEA